MASGQWSARQKIESCRRRQGEGRRLLAGHWSLTTGHCSDDGGNDTVADEPKNPGDPFDAHTIRFLAAVMSRHDLNEIDLRDGERRIRLLRGGHVVMGASTPGAYAPGSPVAAARRPSPRRPLRRPRNRLAISSKLRASWSALSTPAPVPKLSRTSRSAAR